MLVFPPLKSCYDLFETQAIDYLLSAGQEEDAEAFIEKKGLKYVFPALMGKVSISRFSRYRTMETP